MPRGTPRGPSMRRIAQYGEQADIRSVVREVDTSTDWDDETETAVTTSVNVLTRDIRRPVREPDELGDDLSVDLQVYVYLPDLPDGFPMYEYGDKSERTFLTIEGQEYVALRINRYSNETARIEVMRR